MVASQRVRVLVWRLTCMEVCDGKSESKYPNVCVCAQIYLKFTVKQIQICTRLITGDVHTQTHTGVLKRFCFLSSFIFTTSSSPSSSQPFLHFSLLLPFFFVSTFWITPSILKLTFFFSLCFSRPPLSCLLPPLSLPSTTRFNSSYPHLCICPFFVLFSVFLRLSLLLLLLLLLHPPIPHPGLCWAVQWTSRRRRLVVFSLPLPTTMRITPHQDLATLVYLALLLFF